MFFVTVACGILSGFHSTQTAIISRTVKSEKEGRMTFYNMMVLEGFIAMVWAAGAMGVYNLGYQAADSNLATDTIGIVCKTKMCIRDSHRPGQPDQRRAQRPVRLAQRPAGPVAGHRPGHRHDLFPHDKYPGGSGAGHGV